MAKANDPQITQTVSTLEPGGVNLISKQTFVYDRYSNRTDSYEYGFWNGTAWPLIRRSTTSYLTIHPVSAQDYASQTVTAASIHLRNLPTQSSVYDAAGVEQSRRTFEYDNYAVAAGGYRRWIGDEFRGRSNEWRREGAQFQNFFKCFTRK